MKPFLSAIIGDPGRSTLESRIYNALTFFTPLATVFVIPLFFIIELSIIHRVSVLLICSLGFYLYYLSRFKKIKSEQFLIITGLVLLSAIWLSGYGSVGYVFLFYQFLMLYSLLVLEGKSRMIFFLLVPVIVLGLTLAEYHGLYESSRYPSENKRIIDFAINYSVWFVFTGLIIKIIIDNFRMERQRMADELMVARKLQLRLLPQEVPEMPGFSMHALYLPMAMVGGDFYGCSVSGGRIDIFIADVSGHGLPGAFIATITKMALESERPGRSPAEILTRVNSVVMDTTVDGNFITAFYCSIDRATLSMRCASAGHFPAFVWRRAAGSLQSIKPRGKPLGWIDDPGVEEIEVVLMPGDRLVLYTDGITECCNARQQLFGIGAFTDFIKAGSGRAPRDFTEDLMAELKKFSGADFFDDDITMVVFDVNGEEP